MFPLKDNIGTRNLPVVTIALIIANVVVFFLSIRNGGSIWNGPDPDTVVKYGAIPFELTHPGRECDLTSVGDVICEGQVGVTGSPTPQPSTWFTALSSMFMDAMGRGKFAFFYLLGGLAAMGLQTAVDPSSTVPSVGASGAVAAVLGGYLLLYPRARVLTLVFLFVFFTFIQIPAMFFLVIWFGQQLVFGYLDYADPTGGGGGVAYFAHIGGFLFGLLTVRLLATRYNPDYDRPRFPVY